MNDSELAHVYFSAQLPDFNALECGFCYKSFHRSKMVLFMPSIRKDDYRVYWNTIRCIKCHFSEGFVLHRELTKRMTSSMSDRMMNQ